MNKIFVIFSLLLAFAQCKPGQKNIDTDVKHIPAYLLGNFKDDYDIRYTINEKLWIQHPNAIYHLLSYDSAGKFFIARNDSKNPSDAGLYSRIDIMSFTNMEPWGWGFCLTAYNAKTPAEATAAIAADRANPKKGCGGYPFSRMKKE